MKRLSNFASLCILAGTASVGVASDLRRTWTLYHSADPKQGESGFSKRGVLTLEPGENEVYLSIENHDNSFSSQDLETMMASGWYQLRLVEDGSADKKIPPVVTTVPACQVRRSNFRDEIHLIFGQQGHVISMAYSPLVSPLAPKTCDDLPAPSEIKLNSKVDYEAAVPGMVLKSVLGNYQPPPGLKFIPTKNKAAGAAGGETKPEGFDTKEEKEADNSMFGVFKRYWYIFVPLMLMQMITSEPPQSQQGQSEGGAAQEGQSAPAASGSPTKQRRGKRG